MNEMVTIWTILPTGEVEIVHEGAFCRSLRSMKSFPGLGVVDKA